MVFQFYILMYLDPELEMFSFRKCQHCLLKLRYSLWNKCPNIVQ